MNEKLITGKLLLTHIYETSHEVLSDDVIKEVINKVEEGIVLRSERLNKECKSVLSCLSNEELEEMHRLEEKYKTTFCHVIHTTMAHGTDRTYISCPEAEDIYSLFEKMDDECENGVFRVIGLISNRHTEEMSVIGIRTVNGGFERVF